jgi:hypothetical protein
MVSATIIGGIFCVTSSSGFTAWTMACGGCLGCLISIDNDRPSTYQGYCDKVVFDTQFPSPMMDAMEWLSFLKGWYLMAKPPKGDISVCTLGVAASKVLAVGQLLLNPLVLGLVDGSHKIVKEIARQVDWVFVEYGIDISPLLEERCWLHHLQRKVVAHKSSLNWPKRHRRGKASPVRQKKRRLQDNDYLVLFGGNMARDYNQSNIKAFWDLNFYWFEDASGNLDAIYGFDNGGGVKDIPVMYFPSSSNPITPEEIPFGISNENTMANLGGEF